MGNNNSSRGGSSAAPAPRDHIRDTFDSIDIDKSGALSLSELEIALGKLKLPSYHATEIFKAADTNHDGSISFEEFKRYCSGREKELKSTFEYWDRENTGTINRNDLHNILADLGLHPTSADLQHLTSIFSKSNSGTICYSEFRDTLLLLKACDFSKIADEWMHYNGDVGGGDGGGTKVRVCWFGRVHVNPFYVMSGFHLFSAGVLHQF